MINISASTNAASKQLLPPCDEIMFKKEDHLVSPGLVKYIADKKNIGQSEAEELLNSFCKEWEDKISKGEILSFTTLGSIQKNDDDITYFRKEGSPVLLQPIDVNDTYQRGGEAVLDDKELQEPGQTQQPEIFENSEEEEVVVERSYWGLWALILLATGFVMLFYHFKGNKLNGTSVGNHHSYSIDSAAATYNRSGK